MLDFSRLEREVREAVTDVDNVVSSVVFGPEEQVLRVLLLLAGETRLVVRDSGERLDQELELERLLMLARVELDPLLAGCMYVSLSAPLRRRAERTMERLTEVGQTRHGRQLVGGARDEAREATLRR